MIDLLVAGGGPVGLAVAVRARMAGLDVVVVEPRTGAVDKACGEGLMPSAVAALRDMGIDVSGWPFAGIAYVSGRRRVEARFRSGTGVGVRRTSLHDAIAARAEQAGVVRVTGRVGAVTQTSRHVEAAGHRARWLVAADGLHSPVRRRLGLDRPARSTLRFGLRRHYQVAPWSPLVEVHWAAHAEAYVTPVGPDLVGVALLCGAMAHRQGYQASLDGFPALVARLGGAPAVTSTRGAGPLWQRARSPRQGRVLLAGDAAGYVDALTGEGLATGLATAAAAVDAIVADDPASYAARWRAATRDYRWITTALVTAADRPVLRRAVVPAAQRLPWLFGAAVNALS